MGHIVTASLISAPAAILIARLMVPPPPVTADERQIKLLRMTTSGMDAITKGTTDGVKLLVQIVAMLVVLVALVHLVNQILGLLPNLDGQPVTLQRGLAVVMAPVAWLMGIPWAEAQTAGGLLGTKIILNEFLAYQDLAALGPEMLSADSRIIMTYALCGFANLGSLGIMIGGLGAMAPERRTEVVSLGMRAIVSGTLATCMTGAIVGIIG